MPVVGDVAPKMTVGGSFLSPGRAGGGVKGSGRLVVCDVNFVRWGNGHTVGGVGAIKTGRLRYH